MNKEKMFIARDEDGIEKAYEMLLVKNVDSVPVIWYTDGTSDEAGNKNIYISQYERVGNSFQLNPVESEELINKYAEIFENEVE